VRIERIGSRAGGRDRGVFGDSDCGLVFEGVGRAGRLCRLGLG
jgi:hypothetical protein